MRVPSDYEVLVRSADRQAADPSIVQGLIQSAEKKMSGARDLSFLAECVLTYLKDKQWARRIYQRALQAPDADRHLSELTLSIKNRLGDAAWAQKL